MLWGGTLCCAQEVRLPYEKMGWTQQEAAAHLLNRFAYGPTHGQIGKLAPNLNQWVGQQISSPVDKGAFEKQLLQKYPVQKLSTEEIARTYPPPGVRLIFMSRQQGQGRNKGHVGSRGDMGGMAGQPRPRASANDSTRQQRTQNDLFQSIVNAEQVTDPRYLRLQKLVENRFGWKDFTDLFYQMMSQKMERAILSPNQLEEVMVDFWLNHFNVSIHGVNETAVQVYSYERDAIRPHALGSFRDLLGATARHPAMLHYLDNNRSNADGSRETLTVRNAAFARRQKMQMEENLSLKQFAQQPGVNENYARELLELHTLGVEGGYAQKDIEEIARAFTGWKSSPLMYPLPEEQIAKAERLMKFSPKAVLEGGFLFDPTRHDAEGKMILGEKFKTGGGIEEGERVLDMLAAHPSTAKFISKKLAVRFVSDTPSEVLVAKMADTFVSSQGNIQAVLTTMVEAEEFWDKKNLAAKIKTPFEVLVSALRATDAEVSEYRELIRWCTRMGQPLYAYQAPTGYPENAAFWTNGAALVNRMNFASELASGDVQGVNIDLLALNEHHEPASEKEALAKYLGYLLPGRDTQTTYDLLLPILSRPDFNEAVGDRASSQGMATKPLDDSGKSTGLAKVVGLLLGCPEFQRQ